MMGCEGEGVHQSGSGWSPVFVEDNLSVMSAGFLLPSPGQSFYYTLFLNGYELFSKIGTPSDAAVIWRGPKKNGTQFYVPPN